MFSFTLSLVTLDARIAIKISSLIPHSAMGNGSRLQSHNLVVIVDVYSRPFVVVIIRIAYISQKRKRTVGQSHHVWYLTP